MLSGMLQANSCMIPLLTLVPFPKQLTSLFRPESEFSQEVEKLPRRLAIGDALIPAPVADPLGHAVMTKRLSAKPKAIVRQPS